MKPNWIIAALASVIVMSGCGPETSGDSRPPNPAESVFEDFETFSIENQEGLPEVLPNTAFYDFYQGLEPADGEDDQNTSSAVRQRLNELMGLTPSEGGKTYIAARNPIDFLDYVINSNTVGNFNEGRQLMRDVIAQGVAALYNSRPRNGTTIQFTELESDELWVFPLLDWRNSPQVGTVSTARQFVASRPDDESEPQPEIQSMLWSRRIDESVFSVSGYNQPQYERFSITTRTLGNATLDKEYIRTKSDILVLASPSSTSETENGDQCKNVPPEDPLGVTIAGENPDCIRVEIDYDESRVRVFTSRGEAPVSADCKSFNANYCVYQASQEGKQAEAVVYESETINSRQ